ncbi:MAG: four helix bundle protein [Candidatus Brennerbacteria bacterium]
MKTHTYRDLTVWQKGVTLTVEMYKLTEKFPKEELYGLTSQMRRAAISIPSNIAEGKLRGSDKELRKFLLIAFGSGGELETQLEASKKLGLVNEENCAKVSLLLDGVMRMLNTMISQLTPNA